MKKPRYRYCPRCAERLAPGAALCPMCGTSLPSERDGEGGAATEEAGASRGRSALFGGLIAAFTALLLFSIVVLPLLTRALPDRFIACQAALIPAPGASGSLILTAGSDDPVLSDYLRGSRVTLRYSTGRDGLLLTAGLDLMSSPVLSAALSYDDPVLGVCLPQLKDVTYTADLPALLDNFGFILPDPDTPAPTRAQIAAVLARCAAVLAHAVTVDDLTLEKAVPVVLMDGREVTADLYTFTPSPSAVRDALRELADALDSDEDMLAVLTYLADLDGAVFPARKGREGLLAVSDILYDNADAWAEFFAEPLVWTLAVEKGQAREIRLARGDFILTLNPGEDGLFIKISCPWLFFLEGVTFRLVYTPGDGPEAPDSPREDLTDCSLPRLLTLVRELADNVGGDILYAFGDILDILGI